MPFSSDSNAELNRLKTLGKGQYEKGQFSQALKTFNEQLNLSKTLNNKQIEGEALYNIGFVYSASGEKQKSTDLYAQALSIFEAIENQYGIALSSRNIGDNYFDLGELKTALAYYQKSLPIYKSIDNKEGEGTVLISIGRIHSWLNNIPEALKYFKQAQVITGTIYDQPGLADAYFEIGNAYHELGETQRALNNFEQALLVYRSINERTSESKTLVKIGTVYFLKGINKKALDYYEQAQSVSRIINDSIGLSRAFSGTADVYSNLGDKEKALEYYEKALHIYKILGDRDNEGITLVSIGDVYSFLGNKQQALNTYELAKLVYDSEKNQPKLAYTLFQIGNVYSNLSDDKIALDYYERALIIYKTINDKSGERLVLESLSDVYMRQEDNQKALDCYEQSLLISKATDNLFGTAGTYLSIGHLYSKLKERQKALSFYEKSLLVFRAINDRWGIATSSLNIGTIYAAKGENQKALYSYEEAISIYRANGDREGEANVLDSIGIAYLDLGEEQKALNYLMQSLTIYKEVGSRDMEVKILDDLSQTAQAQNRPELGIFFLKESVNTIQSLLRNISNLPNPTQKVFAKSRAKSYRKLAVLLLEKGRVLEAQQVLDLLKVYEIDDYFGDNLRGKIQAPDVAFSRAEEQLSAQFGKFFESTIKIGQEEKKLKLKARNGLTLSAEDQKKLVKYDQFLTQVNGKFIDFINSAEVQEKIAQLNNAKQQQIPLDLFVRLRKNLSKLGDAALVYPLIMDDRIELTITVAESPSLRRTVKIPQSELNQTILDFREALETPSIDPKPLAHKLYTWLIEPLEADLAQANIHTIIYAPDGPLRYVPLAALYDGKQWIAQRFAINNITSASITDLDPTKAEPLRVLAGAFADEKKSYKIQVGDQAPLTFHGLPYAGQEVNDLAETIPNTDKRIDQAFSLKTLKPSFDEYSILHFATHAAFFPARPEDSFILFGDGEQASLNSINDWTLNGVDLVVLSSCESGLGVDSSPYTPKSQSSKLGSGVEILGLGYQFQHSGAKATIASLWAVDDGGTQTLMSAFYKLLSKGNITKVEALRQAQVELITGQVKSEHKDLTHPRYWAPFFLIGNGL